jgi:hypothetical protein
MSVNELVDYIVICKKVTPIKPRTPFKVGYPIKFCSYVLNTYEVKFLLMIDLEKPNWYQMKPHELLFKL